MIVVDASVLAPVVADSGGDGTRYRRRLGRERLAGPDLLRIEVMSVLRRQLSATMIDSRQAAQAVDDLMDLPITVYPTGPLLRRAWALRHNLTSYDACCIALAEALGCPLLTADHRLSRVPGLTCAIELL